MSDNPTPEQEPAKPEGQEPEKQERSFTQADVDRIVADRLKREREATTAKYADYDDLRTKAEGARTLEDRVAEIEDAARKAEERALRAEVANAKGLTANQAKRLVGSTREELEADADELLADIGAQKKQGAHVPDEGRAPNPAKGSKGEAFAEFAEEFFTR